MTSPFLLKYRSNCSPLLTLPLAQAAAQTYLNARHLFPAKLPTSRLSLCQLPLTTRRIFQKWTVYQTYTQDLWTLKLTRESLTLPDLTLMPRKPIFLHCFPTAPTPVFPSRALAFQMLLLPGEKQEAAFSESTVWLPGNCSGQTHVLGLWIQITCLAV